MKLLRIVLPVFFTVTGCCLIRAQARAPLSINTDPGRPSVQSLTVGDGLPQGFVNSVVQDKQGFIWMGTRGGLARYDGYKVMVFQHSTADSLSIASNIILSLYLDRQNRIWIRYEGHAVDIFDPVTHSVKHISPESELGWLTRGWSDLPFNLYEDSRHRYWVVSYKQDQLQYFTLDHPGPKSVAVPPGEKLVALQEDKSGVLWVCTSRALYIVHHDSLTKEADLPRPVYYNNYRIGHMAQDEQGRWIIPGKGCLQIYSPDHHWQIIPTPFPHEASYWILKAYDGKIYLNAGNEILRLHADHTLSVIWTNQNIPNDIQAMMIDRSGVMWVGTDTFGARMINLSFRGFYSYPYHYGFIYDVLHALHFPGEKKAYQDNIVSYLFRSAEDRQGNLWLVNYNSPSENARISPGYLPVYRLNDSSALTKHIPTHSPGWLQIAFDDHDRCWTILYDRDIQHCQLAKVDLSSGKLLPVMPLPFPAEQVAYLVAFHHKIYIIYKKALQVYDSRTKKSVFYQSETTFDNATLLMAVPDPRQDSILWLTSIGNGLIKMNVQTGNVRLFTEEDGLPNNTVYAAIPDKHGNLWCSSNKGIFRFNPVNGKVLSFTAEDGLQGNEFNRYHFFKSPEGQFFFGGTQGWTSFYPDAIRVDSYQPPAVITGILVNNKPITQFPQWKDSVVSNMRVLSLSYKQKFFTFSFAGLEFNDAGKLSYRYRLKGFDPQWVTVGTQHTANYTNLSPGHYTFEVNASNTAGIWSRDIRTLQVIILPPWWKTWWAYALYGVILLATGYVFYRYRMNRLYLRNEMILKEKEAEQLRAMDEMKTRFFSNVTHELRTPLSLIISPLEQIMQEKDIRPAVKKNLSWIQRNAHQLLLLINQLLDLSKMEAGNMSVSLSRGELGRFVADNIMPFNNQAERKSILLDFDNRIQGEYLFDAEKWQKIISNLLSNAVKFTPEGGRVQVRLTASPKGDVILLEVEDTGIGIPEEKQAAVFNRFYQVDDSRTRTYGGSGIGLALTKELTELMGGTIAIKSEKDKGSMFCVSIPVARATNEEAPPVQDMRSDLLWDGKDTEDNSPKTIMSKTASLILVAEDNEQLNQFIAHILTERKYRVITAANGREALLMAHKNLPDVIISDIMMPEMDGYALCEKIKQDSETDHIAFILLSVRAARDSVIKGLGSRADDYITKPFHPDELLLRVQNLLNRQQKLRGFYNRQLTHPEVMMSPGAVDNPFLSQLYQVIEDHIDQTTLSVEKLAEKMGMSRHTLNRKLEMFTGLSTNKTIRQYRLKKAAALLQSGCAVSEAAYRTGFESPSYFSVSFKACYGVSPSEYASNSLQ